MIIGIILTWVGGFLVGAGLVLIAKRHPAAPTPQLPQRPWMYLGQAAYGWHKVNDPNKTTTHEEYVRFYARGHDLSERRVEYRKVDPHIHDPYNVEESWAFTKQVPDWLAGGLVSGPIDQPSPAFIEWRQKNHKRTWNYATSKWEDMPDPEKKLPEQLKPDDDLITYLAAEAEKKD